MKVISFAFFFIFLSNICLALECFECQDKDDETNCKYTTNIESWRNTKCSGSCFKERRQYNPSK